MTDLTSTATVMGTPAFMSPEQLRSTRDVDARGDIWALGAIVYALLTGRPPYEGESSADVSAKIMRDFAPRLREARPDAPVELERAVLRCLEKDPADRFRDVAELVHALAAVVKRDSVKAMASRVARLATGIAPTQSSKGAGTASVPVILTPQTGATRTASAWGDSGRHDQERRRRRTSLLVIGLGATAAAAVGVWRWQPSSSSLPSASSVASSHGTEPTATPRPVAPPEITHEAPAVAVPSTTAVATVVPSAPLRNERGRPRHEDTPPRIVLGSSRVPGPGGSATAATAPSAQGLFNSRQ